MIHKKLSVPQQNDWDQFWGRSPVKKSGQISWSKRRIISVLEPFIINGQRALDAGCGSGFFSKYFCERGMKTVSLDYSLEALKITKELTDGQSQVLKKNLIHEALINAIHQPFDLIFTDGLFEHFTPEDQDNICQNLKSVLAANGILVTFVPNRWSPWELIRPIFMPGIDEKPFILSELVDLNTRNGLQIIKKGGVNTLPFFISPEKLAAHFWGMLLYTVSKK